jgi:hypothetical protein
MKTTLIVLMLSLAANSLLGQAHIVKQRARELSDQNNARQGIPPTAPGTPGRPAPTPAPPAGPPQPMVASPEVLRQYDVSTVKGDIAAVKTGTAIEAGQTDQLTKNLTTAARGTAKPSAKALAQLSQDLGAALSQARLTEPNQAQLAEDVVSLLNCGGVSAADTQAKITSVQATLQRGGVERKLAVAVANDFKVISGEIQKSKL